jgi:hypothetical protein
MTVHVFDYTDWFINRQEDWDCDFYYLIVDGNEVELINSNSQYWQEKMRERFPDRIEHGDLSRHRGHLECSGVTDKLKQEHPEVYDRLNRWCEFKDRRI